MISTRCLKFTGMGVVYIFGMNKHKRIFTNHTCGVFLNTAVLYAPVSAQFTRVLCQNKQNIVQNSQMAQYDRALHEGFLNTIVVCWGGPTDHEPVGAQNLSDFKQHQFHVHFNPRASITWRLKSVTI